MTDATAHVRAELRDDVPLVATETPRLTWQVADAPGGWRQRSVDLTDGVDTVTLDTSDSVLVAWPFAPLAAGERRDVAVRVHSTAGESTRWSAPTPVTAAFLAEGEWVAEPVGLASPSRDAQPFEVRTRFALGDDVARAELLWTALGVAEPRVNGVAVSDDVLAPGWTAYRDRLVHETVDVTELVHPGENELAAAVAGAWYTEKYGFFTFTDRLYGTQPSFLAQVRITAVDGTVRPVAATDASWEAAGDGPVVDSGIYAGEHQDLRRTAAAWTPVRVGAAAKAGYESVPVPEARIAPPVRRVQTLPVADVIASPSGGRILDFGQNLVGRLRIRAGGERGTRLVVRHAEVLENGELGIR
ncbi:MAG: alpha-L-rhamnosidase, partial [Zunongwangia sp.]|nr:alpha-L-rhamnosidase [Zunongwangia sp.]